MDNVQRNKIQTINTAYHIVRFSGVLSSYKLLHKDAELSTPLKLDNVYLSFIMASSRLRHDVGTTFPMHCCLHNNFMFSWWYFWVLTHKAENLLATANDDQPVNKAIDILCLYLDSSYFQFHS
jgi:hypothetical protein